MDKLETIASFEGKFAFLSNFFPSPIFHENILYPTNEHFFQAMKTMNIDEREAIAKAKTPGIAKRMGRRVTLRPDWEEIKIEVMRLGLMLKFTNRELAEQLLATGDADLIEGNTWHDNTWGICFCEKCGCVGKNWLGHLLMELREELKKERE